MSTPNLSEALDVAISGTRKRLQEGSDYVWTRCFLELSDSHKHPNVLNEDLEPLVPRAFRGASSSWDKQSLCSIASRRRLAVAVPELIRILSDSCEARYSALFALGTLDLWEAVDQRLELALRILRDTRRKGSTFVASVAQSVIRLDPATVAPVLLDLLRSGAGGCDYERLVLCQCLFSVGERGAAPFLQELREHADPWYREQAAAALARIGSASDPQGVRPVT
jgi:hypothetical protein